MLLDKLISVIIPVYNAEKYLKRCIDSIINQTYYNIEIVLVNDGSTDNSLFICNEYSNIDNRIKVINKENAGPSLARQDGVNFSSGDYIIFIDADDYIDENMIELLMSKVEENTDIVQCGYRNVSLSGELLKSVSFKYAKYEGNFECALYYASQINTSNFLWNKIFRSSLIKNAIYPKLYAGEDSCLLAQAYSIANQVITIEKPLYNYVQTPDSLCREPFSEKKLGNIEAGKFMYNYYYERHPKLSGFSALHICSYAAKLYCEIKLLNDTSMRMLQDQLADEFNRYYRESKSAFVRKRSSKKRIIFVELFNFSPALSAYLYKNTI